MVYFITAHEVAHQWFGMQVEAANVQGRHFILETLSQYAALTVIKEKYSEEKVQQFLEMQLEKYTDGKRKEAHVELSLALVENEACVYYVKCTLAMYTLQQTIGEDKANLAIKRFLEAWNTIDGTVKTTTKNYTTS